MVFNGDVKTGPSYRLMERLRCHRAHRPPELGQVWPLVFHCQAPCLLKVDIADGNCGVSYPHFFGGKKDEQNSKTTFMETLFWSTMLGHSRTSICILCTLFLARCHMSIWQSISQCSLQLLQLFSGFHLVILDYVSAAAVVKVDKERSATNENASVSTSFWWLIDSIWSNFINIII